MSETKIVTGHFQGGKQMSIYDFLPDGESQEVQPSETVPQVDEAQAVNYYVTDKDGNNVDIYPSSALDVENTVEVTDKALISADYKYDINQVVTVVNPHSSDDEDYGIVESFKGFERRIISRSRSSKGVIIYETTPPSGGLIRHFYEHELK